MLIAIALFLLMKIAIFISDDQKKNALIAAIKHYLVSDGQLSIEEGENFELSLQQ